MGEISKAASIPWVRYSTFTMIMMVNRIIVITFDYRCENLITLSSAECQVQGIKSDSKKKYESMVR